MGKTGNLLADIPAALPEELFQTILGTTNFRVERIVSHGHRSPDGFWYDQDEDEWVLLISGSARIRFEGERPIELTPGAYLYVPAHRWHRVEWTDPDRPTVWLAIHHAAAR